MKTSTTVTTTIISEYGETEQINWPEIIGNLNLKFPLQKIAMRIGNNEKTLCNLKLGYTKEPKFSTGLQILALHGLEFPEQHKQMGLA